MEDILLRETGEKKREFAKLPVNILKQGNLGTGEP